MTTPINAATPVSVPQPPTITIKLSDEGMEKFTTLLQSGIEIETTAGESILSFLEKIPGFTPEYIDNEVQTIFLNGTAMDDVHAPLTESDAVVALSAAMPGLSGAIYRKNSIHSHLRSVHHTADQAEVNHEKIAIYLKLFNSIAKDRGAELLRGGVTMKTGTILTFFQTRPWLLDQVQEIAIEDAQGYAREALVAALEQNEKCRIVIAHSS